MGQSSVHVREHRPPIDRAAILYELGHFLAGIESLSDDAERHFRAALDFNPEHARSLAGIASLRAAGAKYAESNPELVTNAKVQSQWDAFEHVNHKRRRAYVKDLAATS